MAKQTGVFKFTGTLDGVTYYNSKYGLLVRRKGGPSAEQVKNEPAFKRVRENGKEFGGCGKATKLIRAVLKPLMRDASDHLVTGRLNKLMFAVKNLDTVSNRGERNVANGINSAAAKDLVAGFNFNESAKLDRVLKKRYAVNTTTGMITVPGLIPKENLAYPKGATHVKITGGWTRIDFANNSGDLVNSNVVVLPKNNVATNVLLTPGSLPSGTGKDIFVVKIIFYQEVNGKEYSLKNGDYNSMGVVGVG